mgnify:CR=1 FL=1
MFNQSEEVGELGFTTVAIFIAGDGGGDVGSTGGDVVVNREGGIELELLREVADTQTASGRGFSGVSLVFIGEDFEKRSFTASVPPDEANFFTSRNCFIFNIYSTKVIYNNFTPRKI